jgi:hypothetical protein
MFNWDFGFLSRLRRILSHRTPSTSPSVVCEKCNHRQSPQTTNDAVLASLMTLNAYLLAIFTDLEIQYGTIRSREIEVVVCVLIAGSFLGFIGLGFWIVALILPWTVGFWVLLWCMKGIFKDLVNSLAEDNGGMDGQGEKEETDYHLVEVETKEHTN